MLLEKARYKQGVDPDVDFGFQLREEDPFDNLAARIGGVIGSEKGLREADGKVANENLNREDFEIPLDYEFKPYRLGSPSELTFINPEAE